MRCRFPQESRLRCRYPEFDHALFSSVEQCRSLIASVVFYRRSIETAVKFAALIFVCGTLHCSNLCTLNKFCLKHFTNWFIIRHPFVNEWQMTCFHREHCAKTLLLTYCEYLHRILVQLRLHTPQTHFMIAASIEKFSIFAPPGLVFIVLLPQNGH